MVEEEHDLGLQLSTNDDDEEKEEEEVEVEDWKFPAESLPIDPVSKEI